MNLKLIIGAALILLAIIFSANLYNQSKTKVVKPTPTPKSTSNLVIEAAPTPLPTLVPLATPDPVTKPVTTTKGGLVTTGSVKGTSTKTTTTVVTKTLNPLYDTSFDSIKVTNFPGQELEKELILYNKSDKPVLFSARASEKSGPNIPVTVNGSFEATGKIAALSQEIVKIKVKSNLDNPNFSYAVTINFISESNQILSTRTVKVTAYTPIGDRFYLSSDAGDKSIDVAYKSNASYPLRIENHSDRDINFTAKVNTPDANGKFAISATNGFIPKNGWWDTDLHFFDAGLNGLSKIDILFTFKATGNDTYSNTKTLTVNVK